MTPRLVAVLGLVAAVSLAGAAWQWQATHPSVVVAGAGERLLPGLVEEANAVAAITVASGADSITVERAGDGFRVRGSGYPIDAARVRKAIVGAMELARYEPKTRNPAKHAAIRVADPAAEGATSRLLTLTGEDGRVLGSVILGRAVPGGFGGGRDAQYVRLPGDDQAWLASGMVEAGPRLADWVTADVVRLNVDLVVRATIRHADGEVLAVKRTGVTEQGTAKFEIEGLAPDSKVKSELGVRYTATDLANVAFEDVRPAAATGSRVSEATLEMADGLTLVYTLTEDEGRHWLAVSVAAPGLDEAAAKAIGERASGWQFSLSDYKAKQFRKRLAELLE